MSKGSGRRPQLVGDEVVAENWNATFSLKDWCQICGIDSCVDPCDRCQKTLNDAPGELAESP